MFIFSQFPFEGFFCRSLPLSFAHVASVEEESDDDLLELDRFQMVSWAATAGRCSQLWAKFFCSSTHLWLLWGFKEQHVFEKKLKRLPL